MLVLNHVQINIDGKAFLQNVSFKLNKGQILHLQGKNGSGKSTLMEVLLGLRGEYEGDILRNFDSNDYGFLPQVAHQFPKIHLLFNDICNTFYDFYPVELKDKSWHLASGGERKKALIAKAMSEAKSLLVLDEPFNHLDQGSAQQVVLQMQEMAASGVAIIYTGHEHKIDGSISCEVSQWKC